MQSNILSLERFQLASALIFLQRGLCTKRGVGKLDFFFLLSIVGTPAPSSERQHPEAWPASTYGYLRGVSLILPSIIYDINLKLNP